MDSTLFLNEPTHFAETFYLKSDRLRDLVELLDSTPRLLAPNIFLITRPRGFGLTLAAEAIEKQLMQGEGAPAQVSRFHARPLLGTLPRLPPEKSENVTERIAANKISAPLEGVSREAYSAFSFKGPSPGVKTRAEKTVPETASDLQAVTGAVGDAAGDAQETDKKAPPSDAPEKENGKESPEGLSFKERLTAFFSLESDPPYPHVEVEVAPPVREDSKPVPATETDTIVSSEIADRPAADALPPKPPEESDGKAPAEPHKTLTEALTHGITSSLSAVSGFLALGDGAPITGTFAGKSAPPLNETPEAATTASEDQDTASSERTDRPAPEPAPSADPEDVSPATALNPEPEEKRTVLTAGSAEEQANVQAEEEAQEKALQSAQPPLPPHEFVPVIRLSLKKVTASTPALLESDLINLLQAQLWVHHLNTITVTRKRPKTVLSELIEALWAKYQKAVAVIIDNYDVPFINASSLPAMYQDEAISTYLDMLNALKRLGTRVKWVLLTGHIKFALSSEMSEGLPQLTDLTYSSAIDTMFGFTVSEVRQLFNAQLKRFAPRHGITADELLKALNACYGHFVFSDRLREVMRPSSVCAAFEAEGLLLPYAARGDYAFLKSALSRFDNADLTWLLKDGQEAIHQETVPLHPGLRDLGVLLLSLGFATIDKVTVTEGPNFINYRYKYKKTNEETERMYRVFTGKAHLRLTTAPINPLVYSAGAHDYDL